MLVFSCLRFKSRGQLFLSLETVSFWTGIYIICSWVSRFPTAELETCQPPYESEPNPYKLSPSLLLSHPPLSLSSVLTLSIIGCVSLENPNTVTLDQYVFQTLRVPSLLSLTDESISLIKQEIVLFKLISTFEI